MVMDVVSQIYRNSKWKADVESLCRGLGASKTWSELARGEIDAKLRKSTADISAGRMLSQDQLDAKIAEL